MRRPVLLALATVLALGLAGPGAAAPPPPVAPPAADEAPQTGPLADLPDDGPPALYRHEPTLPAADGWPGSESFPRTSGTGRLVDGALLWSDFLYDDHGAITVPGQDPARTAGSPSFGGYGYPAGPAKGNGADIFRAAVTSDGGASYWRVDWNTLVDPAVPMAVWTFDRDSDAATGVAAWPAAAAVRSAGIDTALVVSSRGAQLVDAATGAVTARLPVAVDAAARSFVVRVPNAVLPVTGNWRVRLGAGLADAAGTGLAAATGSLPGQPRLYNVTFRATAQEPQANSFWDDMAQTQALTAGDVSAFSRQVRWADLAARRTTPEARPSGWSTRWYVSAVELGQGVLSGPETITDRKPNYLGRVQPYSVYVPQDLPSPAPLTFLLHSLTQNHNQYAATTPTFTRQACEDRRSLCVTTLGRGGDGFYLGEAQLDFWQVWHEVADAFELDPEATITAGYSMGGIGSNQLAMAHPDLFAQDVTLAGAVGGVAELENLRSVPVYQAGGVGDQLVPVTTQKAQADALAALGYRYRWLVYPAEEHVGLSLKDDFADAAAFMGTARRTTTPARVTYGWSPVDRPAQGGDPARVAQTQRPDLGIGTTGAYWLRALRARPGVTAARVQAVSAALPDPVVTPVPGRSVLLPGNPSPALVQEQTWELGASPARSPAVTLDLAGVSSATLLMADAGLPASGCSTVVTTTDGPSTLMLRSGDDGRTTVSLASGSRTLLVRTAAGRAPTVVGACTSAPATVGPAPGSTGPAGTGVLATTGRPASLPAAAFALLVAGTAIRRRRAHP